MRSAVISWISPNFLELSQSQGQVAHVLLTRSPLIPHRKGFSVRLACVKHAASVRPEPGSNSPTMQMSETIPAKTITKKAMAQAHKHELSWHTVEFSNNTRTPITVRMTRADQRDVC